MVKQETFSTKSFDWMPCPQRIADRNTSSKCPAVDSHHIKREMHFPMQGLLILMLIVNVVSLSVDSSSSRRLFLKNALVVGGSASIANIAPLPAIGDDDSNNASGETDEGVQVFKTKTGLQYIELSEGTGPSPQYGQLCVIHYVGYIKLPGDSEKSQFDATDFLLKHGNGRMIPGLDEGLHTMKEGGKRRLIIPPKLGYGGGLGPIPVGPFNRKKLNRLLDQMVAARGGRIIFDVELLRVRDDEADQGYYQDKGLSAEEFEELKQRIQGARTPQVFPDDSAVEA